MSIEKERYFPRGGNQQIKGGNEVFGHSKKRKLLFQKPEKKNTAKLGKRERAKMREAIENVEKSGAPNADLKFPRIQPLLYKSLCIGLKTLCCVREVKNHFLRLNLPCRLVVTVTADNISQPYLKALAAKAQLSDFERMRKTIKVDEESKGEKVLLLGSMFRVGQVFCCKVIEHQTFSDLNNKVNTVVSLNPKDVNADLIADSVTKGDLIQMAVASREDHGYQMYPGVPGVVAFLPASKATRYETEYNDGKPLAVGQLVWCLVKNCKAVAEGSKMVTVEINPEEMSDNILEDISIPKLNPGTLVDATVARVIPEGIYLRLNSALSSGDSDLTETPLPMWWVEWGQLAPDWSIPKNFAIVGASLKARVLYRIPHLTDYVCLTLKTNPFMIIKPKFERGKMFPDAKVRAVLKGDILLTVTDNDDEDTKDMFGIIPYHEIDTNIEKDEVANVYVPGSEVKCRVVNYDFMEQIYSCTMNQKVLNEKYLSHHDVKVGDALNVTVTKYVGKKGCLVTFGSLKGLVPHYHLADAPSLERPELKIRVGSMYSARVLQIDHGSRNIWITLKPTLVTGKPLINLEEVSSGDSYYGVVSLIKKSSLKVTFFGGIQGHIHFSHLADSLEKYSLHQLVKCYITKTESGEVLFSLLDCQGGIKEKAEQGIKVEEESIIPLKEGLKDEKNTQKGKHLIIGNQYSLRVVKTKDTFINAVLETEHKNYNVRIPIRELSDLKILRQVKLEHYSKNDIIPNALLYKITKRPFQLHFTLRRSIQHFLEETKNLSNLNGVLDIPCTAVYRRKEGLLVSVPIPGFDLPIFIPFKYILGGHQLNELKFPSGQSVIVRMKLAENRTNFETPMYKAMRFRPTVDWVVTNLQCFLEESSRFQTYKTGDTLSGAVIEKNNNYVLIEPSNQVVSTKIGKVILSSRQTTTSYGLGDMVTNATVLFHNPKPNRVQLYNDNSLPVNMTPPDEDVASSFVTGRVVYRNSFFLLALATGGRLHRGCLIYIPTLYHPCAVGLNRPLSDECTFEVSIFIERIVGGYAFGFSKEGLDKIRAKESDSDGDQEEEEEEVEGHMDVKEEEEGELESEIGNGESDEVMVEVADQKKGNMSDIPLKAKATMEVIRVEAKRGKTDMGEGKMAVAKRLKSEVKNIEGIDSKNKRFMEAVELQLGSHGMTETFTQEDAGGFLWFTTPNNLMTTSTAQDGNENFGKGFRTAVTWQEN